MYEYQAHVFGIMINILNFDTLPAVALQYVDMVSTLFNHCPNYGDK